MRSKRGHPHCTGLTCRLHLARPDSATTAANVLRSLCWQYISSQPCLQFFCCYACSAGTGQDKLDRCATSHLEFLTIRIIWGTLRTMDPASTPYPWTWQTLFHVAKQHHRLTQQHKRVRAAETRLLQNHYASRMLWKCSLDWEGIWRTRRVATSLEFWDPPGDPA